MVSLPESAEVVGLFQVRRLISSRSLFIGVGLVNGIGLCSVVDGSYFDQRLIMIKVLESLSCC